MAVARRCFLGQDPGDLNDTTLDEKWGGSFQIRFDLDPEAVEHVVAQRPDDFAVLGPVVAVAKRLMLIVPPTLVLRRPWATGLPQPQSTTALHACKELPMAGVLTGVGTEPKREWGRDRHARRADLCDDRFEKPVRNRRRRAFYR